MEVLNAARLSPVSVQKHPSCIPERRLESKKLFPHKSLLSASKTIGGSLAFISSVLSVESAKSLTYEEALGLSGVSSGASADVPDVDIGGIFDGIISFATENPLLLGGGAVALVVPLVLSQLFKSSPKAWGVVSARSAFAKLSEESGSVLLDIRDAKDFKEVGSPNLKTIKKKAVTITYADDNPSFLKKLALKFKDPENTTLYILDKFDGKSEFVAELATANSFKAAFAIKDGAEGPRGWLKSELPWATPSKGFNLGGLKEAIGSAFGESGDGLPATVGLAAAAGLGLLAFSEIETVLQLLGSAAIVQFTTKKLLYAKDRKVTLQQLDEFLNTKVAPQELVDEIKTIGKALLPQSTTPPASLTAAVEPTTEAGPAPAVEEKVEPVPEVPVVVNAVVDPPKEVNDVPVAEVKAQSAPVIPRPLSPYPYYPDFKPPSSPSPSRP